MAPVLLVTVARGAGPFIGGGKEDAMSAAEKVLIIDNNSEHCKAIKDALDGYGVGAYYALSVVDGIEQLIKHHYELVILDISLSERDGLQLLRFMRQTKDMPILVLSSQGDYESKKQAYIMGATIFWRSRWSPGSACSGHRPFCGDTAAQPHPRPESGAIPSSTLKICGSIP